MKLISNCDYYKVVSFYYFYVFYILCNKIWYRGIEYVLFKIYNVYYYENRRICAFLRVVSFYRGI